jgi:transposase InsO family protein
MTLEEAAYERLLNDVRSQPGRAGRLVAALAAKLGCSKSTVYRQLRARGWTSGRKRRRDAGQCVVAKEDAERLARILAMGRNKRGQLNIPVREVTRIAEEHELLEGDASYSTILRALNVHGLGPRHLKAPEAGISRVSLHPNAVWFLDISVGIQWYFRDKDGRRLQLYRDAGARFYEGKVQNFRALRQILHRYVVTDHRTGAYYVRYYYSSGERSEDVVDFLWHAMSAKGLDAFPFRGVPRTIVVDKGSAFRAAIVRELLVGLGVEVQEHRTKNPKASGSVESRHGHWQASFEGRLANCYASDLDEINDWALRFAATAQGTRVHSRHGHTPMAAWSTIASDQLVEAPDRATFFRLATTTPDTRVLDGRQFISVGGREWHISGLHTYPGQKITYRLTPFSDPGLRAWDEHGRELAALEIARDEMGMPLTGPRHVFGSEDESEKGASLATTPAQQVLADIEVEPEKIAAMFDRLDDQLGGLSYLPRQGQAWTPPEEVEERAAAPALSSLEAREQLFDLLGRPLDDEEYAWWHPRLEAGVTTDQLQTLFDTFTQRGTAAR